MGCAGAIQDDMVNAIRRWNCDCHGKVARPGSIGAGVSMVFAKSGQQIWAFELCLISLSKARSAKSSLGNMMELKESCFFHSNNLSLFDRFVSLHKASLVNLCRQKPRPSGSGCRVCSWLMGPNSAFQKEEGSSAERMLGCTALGT